MKRPSGQNGIAAGPKMGGLDCLDGGPIGAIVLAGSGLITSIDRKAAELLRTSQNEAQNRSFNLFVERSELAVFYSHWNKLLSTSENQLFEITLKGAGHKTRLSCSVTRDSSGKIEEIRIVLDGKPDRYHAVEPRVQPLQDLPSLIFAISSGISAADARHLDRSIGDALEKIGLFADADHCFIHTLNRSSKRIHCAYEWRRHPESGKVAASGEKSITLFKAKNCLLRLRREKTMTFHDEAQLHPAERNELPAWPGGTIGAGIFYFICQGNIPVGVVGVTRKAAGRQWPAECESLVRFLGDFMAGSLLSTVQGTQPANSRHGERAESGSKAAGAPGRPDVIGSFGSKKSKAKAPLWEAGLRVPKSRSGAQALEKSMRFEPSMEDKADLHLPVFPSDNSQVVLACPVCGNQKSVPYNQLSALGNAIIVTCPCSHRFTILFDRRKLVRKTVHLEAVVTRAGDAESTAEHPKNLGWMVIKDLSKGGLRMASVNARNIRPGDLLMVRFNLDNSSNTLIQKLVQVTSINGDEIGCRFEVADQHDTALGFYLM